MAQAAIVVSSVHLTPELHSAAKTVSQKFGWTLRQLIQRALRNEIERLAIHGAPDMPNVVSELKSVA